MPRSRRISWLNYPHLVMAQANGGADLFADDDDFKSYILQLRQMTRDRLLKVYAYCLLASEVRLVVQPNRLMLSRIMQRLHGRHTARMNQKVGRVGHLFRNRFRSIVFDESSLLDVVRSVHLWPVRLGLHRRPELYPYSSHGFYMGVNSDVGDFLSVHDVLSQFSGDLSKRRRGFGRFVEMLALDADDFGVMEVAPGIGGQNSSSPLLAKANVQKRESSKTSVQTLAERTTLTMNVSLDQMLGSSRVQSLVMARRLLATAAVVGSARTVTEVAQFLRRDKAQISRLVAQGMDLLLNNESFVHLFEALKAKGGER